MAQAVKKKSQARLKTPLVSVVMSVYNGEKYLREAIESILNQTFKDFEFIIINDGSTDDTLKIINSYNDPRIVLISRKNKGLVASLNEGIEKARGKYIARMDADDRSMPQRLEKQIEYMKSHSKVVICGTTFVEIDSEGDILQKIAVPLEDCVIRQELLARCPFAHGSTLYSREACLKAGLYNQEDFPAEDYSLWIKMADQGNMANLSDELFNYRVFDSSISHTVSDLQSKQADKIRQFAWSKWPLQIQQQPKIWLAICNQLKPLEYASLHYGLLKQTENGSKPGIRFKLSCLALLCTVYIRINIGAQKNG